MTDKLLLPKEVQNYVHGKTPGCLATERCLRRDTPPWIKIGKKIYHSESALLKWIDAHKVETVAEAYFVSPTSENPKRVQVRVRS